MAKRFTDTEKWQDEWYGSLSNDYRIVWQYLLDRCSIAGIFKKDFRLLNFQCNTKITESEFFEIFQGRVLDCGSFVFIPKFLKFQYPQGLISNKPAIVSVRKEVENNNLCSIIIELYGNDYLIIKDKDKDKDMVKDEVKGKNKDKIKLAEIPDSEMQSLFEIKAMAKRVEVSTIVMSWNEFREENKDEPYYELSHIKRSFGRFLDKMKLEQRAFNPLAILNEMK